MQRISVISNLYPPTIKGGYEILAAAFSDYARQQGYPVSVLTTEETSPLSRAAQKEPSSSATVQESTSFVASPQRRSSSVASPYVSRNLLPSAPWESPPTHDPVKKARASLFNYWHAQAFFRRHRPQRAFFWNLNRLGLGPLFAALHLKIPSYLTINDYYPLQYQENRWLHRLGKTLPLLRWPGLKGVKVTVISRYLSRELASKGFVPPQQEIIYQGIDLDQFPLKETPWTLHDPLRLIYTGTLSEDKGVHTLIEALALLGDRLNYRLTLVGGGREDFVRQLKNKAAEAGLSHRLDFVGPVPHEAIHGYLCQHDALIFPSLWAEPFGLSQLEALATGLHLICTPVGGVQEMLEQGVFAATFPPGDAPALRDRILEVAAYGPPELERARQATETARARFNMKRYLGSLESFVTS